MFTWEQRWGDIISVAGVGSGSRLCAYLAMRDETHEGSVGSRYWGRAVVMVMRGL